MADEAKEKPQQPETKPKPTQSPLVFISHDSRDAELAAHFSNLLFNVSSGLLKSFCSSNKKVQQGVPYGLEWYRSIMKALSSASDVVCLLTERSFERPWILYEAGFAKGKLGVPIVGIALGIPLSRASTGPFSQFQNCDDDVKSLIQLVVQLTQRIPGMQLDPDIVKRQVEFFKNEADVIIEKLADEGGPEKEDESPGQKASEDIPVLSKVAIVILDLYFKRDTTVLWKETEIIPALSFSKIQIEAGIDELETAEMIEWSTARKDRGNDLLAVDDWEDQKVISAYSLTKQGTSYLAKNR